MHLDKSSNRKIATEKYYDLLQLFYSDEIPGYVKRVGKTFMEISVGDEIFGTKDLKITTEDVVMYYAYEAPNITSGCRTLAGYTSDWRGIDNLACECFDWFKYVNSESLRRIGRKYGLEPKF